MASPTAASAAATAITKNTKICPPTPRDCAKAMNVRFTALSISSTHMKMMIALRRVRTPTTPIVNSTAEKNSDSASIGLPASREGDGAYDRGEQHHARDLEREQVFMKERSGHRLDRPEGVDLPGGVSCRQAQRLR